MNQIGSFPQAGVKVKIFETRQPKISMEPENAPLGNTFPNHQFLASTLIFWGVFTFMDGLFFYGKCILIYQC